MKKENLTVTEIEALCDRLEDAEEEIIALYQQEYPSEEYLAPFARLWDCCQEYQTAFENFSHQ